ncbi:MAG TPA: hypothetical protein VIY47_05455, partial [Ignavibacteriaceae bacterium]
IQGCSGIVQSGKLDIPLTYPWCGRQQVQEKRYTYTLFHNNSGYQALFKDPYQGMASVSTILSIHDRNESFRR